MTNRLIKVTTALAVVTVAAVAALISYAHMLDLVRAHGETGATARLVPFTVDGLIWAASMVILDASRRNRPVPALAGWSLAAGICATVGANVAHGATHGPIGALVSAWPALALVGSFELLMTLTRRAAPRGVSVPEPERTSLGQPVHQGSQAEQTPEQAVLAEYRASLNGPGRPLSQRFLAEKHGLDRRKVKQIIVSSEEQGSP
ncbi:DUF2637 domain-containing protein [Actinomadura sp. 7K534]|uniref:DUF2637 domain-containing protein n=1 Tax=Actinomadura sp. 7K534 TaxID=2530366 RepID=UPI00105126BC|nr:DUF2637 domain-containing protein [Actinomadura sp. 7K534]TDB85517.1 DUF2637 domain-containing protein [Actinomadura sp. 7K534]